MAKKIYIIRYSDVTFVALFAVFVIAITTALSGISTHSDMLLVGLTTTLAAYTIALQLINNHQNPLKKYKFGSTEFQANLYECEEEALEIKKNTY